MYAVLLMYHNKILLIYNQFGLLHDFLLGLSQTSLVTLTGKCVNNAGHELSWPRLRLLSNSFGLHYCQPLVRQFPFPQKMLSTPDFLRQKALFLGAERNNIKWGFAQLKDFMTTTYVEYGPNVEYWSQYWHNFSTFIPKTVTEVHRNKKEEDQDCLIKITLIKIIALWSIL